MKNNRLFSLVLCCAFQPMLQAQSVTQGVPADAVANATNAEHTIVARAANARVWGAITSYTNKAGKMVTRTNASYTEVAANLCVQDPASGTWSDSDSSLAIVGDGSSSGNSPLAVHFTGDVNAAGATVNLTAPDGKVFVSKVYGISYYDPTVPTNVLIAALQSSQGSLVGNNRIVYQNAFTGLNADIWYWYRPSGLDQDIVLHDCPPSPAAYGLNPQTTLLQVYTEWFNPPQPHKITTLDNAMEDDAYLDFGCMVMGPGAALFTQGQADPVPVVSGTIYKHWTQISGRDWLIEEIPYPVIANVLQAMPLHASAGKPGRSLYENIASSQPLLPQTGHSGASKPIQVAKSTPRQPGLILDYALVSSVGNFNFRGDTTYYVAGNVTMSGSSTTFEGGAVIKYTNNVTMRVNSPVTWLGAAYRPVIMTAKDDNSVGGTISGSTGSPGTGYYAATALNYNGNLAGTGLVLQHLRVLNAQTAVAINTKSNNVLSHVQMVNCGNGLAATNATFSLWNGLMYNVMTNFTGANSTGDVEHLTVDTASFLNTNLTLNLTNCLLVAVTNAGTGISSSYAVYSTNTGSGVFTKVGGGAHYLAANSPYTNAGTTGINPALATALTQMTTFPPVLLTSNFTVNTALSPHAQRDTDLPDIGWHYDPLDYIWSNLTVNSGVTLSLTNGVAVGVLSSTGVTVNGTLTGQGTPVSLDHLASCAVAQEEPVKNLSLLIGGNGAWQGLNLRFADIPTLGGTTSFLNASDSEDNILNAGPLTLRDCQLHGGQMSLAFGNDSANDEENYGVNYSSMMVGLTNNLLDRCSIVFNRVGTSPAYFPVDCYNNLAHAGLFWAYYVLSPLDNPGINPQTLLPWYFYNNLFETCSLGEEGGGTDYNGDSNWQYYVNFSYNGYYNDTPLGGYDNQTLTLLEYQTGALGSFYYKTNKSGGYDDGTNTAWLIHAGSTKAANMGLYHYTVTTNNVMEGTNTVSIGFHYIAVDSSGNPLDTDGDGVPDYLKDSNGDGVYDAGDLCDWQNPFNIYDQWHTYGFTPAHLRLGY